MPRTQGVGLTGAAGGASNAKNLLRQRRSIAFAEIGKLRTIATLAGGPNVKLPKELRDDARRMVNIDYKSGTSDFKKLADLLKPEIATTTDRKRKAALKAEQTFYATMHKGEMKMAGSGVPIGDIFNQNAISSSLTTLTQSNSDDLVFATYIADAVKDGAPKIAGNAKLQKAILDARQIEESSPEKADKGLLQPQEQKKEQSPFEQAAQSSPK